MNELQLQACLRLGVDVYYKSRKTGRVWKVQPDWKLRKRPAALPVNPPDWTDLTRGQLAGLLQQCPNNFTLEL